MEVPYCVCEKHSKELFSNGFLIFGVVMYPLFVIGLLGSLLFGLHPIFFLLLAFVCIQWAWSRLEFKRQALFLSHSAKCASRYATLAAFTTFQGHVPEYGKLTGYKSALKTKAEQLLGKRKTRQAYRASAIVSGLALAAILILLSYDSLTRARNGLPERGSWGRYAPVVSEAILMSVGLSLVAFLLYMYLARWIKNTVALIFTIVAGILLVWVALVYALSQYARLNFWMNLKEASIVLAVVLVFLLLSLFIEKRGLRQKRKKKH